MNFYKNALILFCLAIGMVHGGVKWPSPIQNDGFFARYVPWVGSAKQEPNRIRDLLNQNVSNKTELQYVTADTKANPNYKKLLCEAGFIFPSDTKNGNIQGYGTSQKFYYNEKGEITNEDTAPLQIMGNFILELTDDDILYLVNMLIMMVKGDYAQSGNYPPLVKQKTMNIGYEEIYIFDVENKGDEYYFVMQRVILYENKNKDKDKPEVLDLNSKQAQEEFFKTHPKLFISSYESLFVQIFNKNKDNGYYNLLSGGLYSKSDAQLIQEMLAGFRLSKAVDTQNSDYVLLCHDPHGIIDIELSTQEMVKVLQLIKDYRHDNAGKDVRKVYTTELVDTPNGKRRHTFAFDGDQIFILPANLSWKER